MFELVYITFPSTTNQFSQFRSDLDTPWDMCLIFSSDSLNLCYCSCGDHIYTLLLSIIHTCRPLIYFIFASTTTKCSPAKSAFDKACEFFCCGRLNLYYCDCDDHIHTFFYQKYIPIDLSRSLGWFKSCSHQPSPSFHTPGVDISCD